MQHSLRLSNTIGHREPVRLSGTPQGGISCPSGNSPPGDPLNSRITCVFRVENVAFNGEIP